MARLDPFIDLLFKEKADVLLLETGQPAVLVTGDQVRAAMQRPLTTAQIASACAEVAPGHLRDTFSVFETSDFEYLSPHGRVRIQVEPEADGVRATFEPIAQEQPPVHRGRPRVIELPPDISAPPPPAPKAIEVKAGADDAAAAMHELLELTVAQKASDLHLTTAFTPCLRVDGDIVPIEGYGPISDERLREMLFSIAPPKNRTEWLATKDTDFAHETSNARFRVNIFAERMGVGAVLRQIPTTVMTAEQMGLSRQLLDLCFLHKGLVLVTGPTGSGKSTTLAALIDHANKNRDDHIITIEDPIEFVHQHQRCLVHQREVGVHTQGFKNALRAALREDPDIVLVGELRDLETISIALETAETGHLVFGTLHTNTAPSTVDRIIDQFPPDRQAQVRTMLSESLKAVVAQTLVKKIGGGRAAAQEVLLVNSAVSNLIREGKTFQIPSIMQTQRNAGMVTLNDALYELVKKKVVTPEDALSKAVARSELKALLERLAATP
ncbi:MAG TPA: type IV pilus twitching motility protein PilT [Myxococcales bacterium]|nr:type IV pilus twitching motility protein PilT [Myxococcales bacterium]